MMRHSARESPRSYDPVNFFLSPAVAPYWVKNETTLTGEKKVRINFALFVQSRGK